MLEHIGETAGLLWKYLEGNGETTIPQLIKKIDADEFLVLTALGWLAREDKIEIFMKGRSKAVKLK